MSSGQSAGQRQKLFDGIRTLLITSIAGGADLKTVMDRLGHAQITTTQQYLHTLDSADDTALAAFLRIRHSPQQAPPTKPSQLRDPHSSPKPPEPPGLTL